MGLSFRGLTQENTGTTKDEWVRYPSVSVQVERVEIGKLTLASVN